jgi:hypothetical protein
MYSFLERVCQFYFFEPALQMQKNVEKKGPDKIPFKQNGPFGFF